MWKGLLWKQYCMSMLNFAPTSHINFPLNFFSSSVWNPHIWWVFSYLIHPDIYNCYLSSLCNFISITKFHLSSLSLVRRQNLHLKILYWSWRRSKLWMNCLGKAPCSFLSWACPSFSVVSWWMGLSMNLMRYFTNYYYITL